MKPLNEKGLVADIERASFHDGWGFRTVVFLKGCPLSCRWCHNPECISAFPQTLYYPEKCIGCGRCASGCYSGARVTCGREMTADEVMAEILLDKGYYGDCGGVTFSGGEPLLQSDFLRKLCKLCRENGVKTAIETSLYLYEPDILSQMQLVMADLKIWDNDLHKKCTGVGNSVIKENFEKLDALGVPIIARTPVIPEIPQGIDEISAFLKRLHNVIKYELLPYHSLGESKRTALGLPEESFTVPTSAMMEELKEKYAYTKTDLH